MSGSSPLLPFSDPESVARYAEGPVVNAGANPRFFGGTAGCGGAYRAWSIQAL